jgi:hypothetical protein
VAAYGVVAADGRRAARLLQVQAHVVDVPATVKPSQSRAA